MTAWEKYEISTYPKAYAKLHIYEDIFFLRS